jgi:ribosome-binding factor A
MVPKPSSSQKPFSRTERVAGTVHREIARLLREEYKDPRVGMVTVLDVTVTKDLSHAQVFISVLDENQAKATVALLNKTAGFFRSQLAKILKFRIAPQVQFVYDDAHLRGNRINDILRGVLDGVDPEEPN